MPTPDRGGLPPATPFRQSGATYASDAPSTTVQPVDLSWMDELQSEPVPSLSNGHLTVGTSNDSATKAQSVPPVTRQTPGQPPEVAQVPKSVPRRLRSWQFWVYWLTLHLKNPGLSRKEELLLRQAQLEAEIASLEAEIASFELIDWFVITVLSIIGGIGKTMIAAYLLHLFGTIRVNDRGVGIDNNPDMGVYAKRLGVVPEDRLPLEKLYAIRDSLKTYSQAKRTIPFKHGYAVVGAGTPDKKFYKHFTEEVYDAILGIFIPHASGAINDAGTGLLSTPISEAAIARTNVAVVVADPSEDSIDAANQAHDDFLEGQYANTIANSVLVINRVKPDDDVTLIREQFHDTFRVICEVPWDEWMSNRNNSVNLGKISLEAHIALLKVLRAVLQGIQAETRIPSAFPSDVVAAGSTTQQGV